MGRLSRANCSIIGNINFPWSLVNLKDDAFLKDRICSFVPFEAFHVSVSFKYSDLLNYWPLPAT